MRIDFASKSGFEITPGAGALARRPQGVYVGATGNVVAKFVVGGPDVTFVAVPAGTVLPISPAVLSTCGSCVGL